MPRAARAARRRRTHAVDLDLGGVLGVAELAEAAADGNAGVVEHAVHGEARPLPEPGNLRRARAAAHSES